MVLEAERQAYLERHIAGRAGDRAQPRALDGAAGPGRGSRDDEDAQAALLRARRTVHPLGPGWNPAPAPVLALVQSARSRAHTVTGDTAPSLTPTRRARPRPRLAPACPRTLASMLSASRRGAEGTSPGSAPPRLRRTLRGHTIPRRHASIGGSGVRTKSTPSSTAPARRRLWLASCGPGWFTIRVASPWDAQRLAAGRRRRSRRRRSPAARPSHRGRRSRKKGRGVAVGAVHAHRACLRVHDPHKAHAVAQPHVRLVVHLAEAVAALHVGEMVPTDRKGIGVRQS